jgi:hypothetical protein
LFVYIWDLKKKKKNREKAEWMTVGIASKAERRSVKIVGKEMTAIALCLGDDAFVKPFWEF